MSEIRRKKKAVCRKLPNKEVYFCGKSRFFHSFLLTINCKINIIESHFFLGNFDISAILCSGQGALARIDTRVKNESIG